MKKIIILISFLLTGCINLNDINNLAIINEIAIEHEDKYKVYIKVLSSNQKNEDQIYTELCNTLDECFSNINNKLSKKLYLTHLDLLILNDNIKKKELKEIVNFFLKEDTSRNSFSTIIVNKITNKILEEDSKDIINLLSLSLESNGLANNKTFDSIVKEILDFNISYIPYIDTNEIKINGYKALYDDNKILNKDESIIVNFIFDNIKTTTLLIDNKTYNLESCKTINKINKNNIIINITCKSNSKDKEIIESYLDKSIKDFINNNKLNYFYYLKNKYNLKGNSNIDSKVKIITIKKDKGDHFE